MTPEEKAEITKASGFDEVQTKRYPTIKFTASDNSKYSNAGSFTLLGQDENGELKATDLGKELKVVFLKRGKLGMKKKPYRTNLVSKAGKYAMVEVYSTKDGKSKFEDEGTWREMKQKYNMSTFQYPYVLISGDDEIIAKLPILPSSLANYWAYLDEFKGGEEVWEYETIVKASDEMEQGNEGNYYLMTFKKGKKQEDEALDYIGGVIKDLRAELQKAEDSYKEKQIEYDRMEGKVSNDDIPIVEEEAPPMDDEEAENLSKESL